VSLDIEARASVTFNLRPAAAAWKTGSARFATEFAVQAADTALSRAANAVLSSVEAAVCAAEGTAESYFLFVDSVVSHGYYYLNCNKKNGR
jgi:hypothetical protein